MGLDGGLAAFSLDEDPKEVRSWVVTPLFQVRPACFVEALAFDSASELTSPSSTPSDASPSDRSFLAFLRGEAASLSSAGRL